MMVRIRTAAMLLALIATVVVGLDAQRGQAGASCDKACLEGIADAYLAALAAHDPSRAPLAANVRFTEQAQPMAIGEGDLWKLTTADPITFKIPVPDPSVGQIGMIVVLKAALPAGHCAAGPAPEGREPSDH